MAQLRHERWVETSREIIDFLNPSGLNGDYFWYGSPAVRVCEFGKRDMIEKKEAQQLGQILHGPEEGIVEGRV